MQPNVAIALLEQTQPQRPGLNCVRLSSVQRKSKVWLWQDRIPLNTLTLIEGDGGRGKSTIVADLCSRLSSGRALEDDGRVREPVKVLLLAAEDDPATVLRPRFEEHGADLDNVFFDDQAFNLSESGIEALSAAIRAHQIKVCVIDPIVAFMGHRVDMNKGNDVRSVLGPLVKLGRELECTFIVVRHFNKGRDGSAAQKGAGSVDFRNTARATLQVIHTEERSYLALEKSNYAARASALSFSIEGGRINWGEKFDLSADQILGIARHETSASGDDPTALERALEFLKAELKDGAKPAKEITRNARDLDISPKTLQRAKAKIGVESVKLPSGWKWQIASEKNQDGQTSNVGNLDHLGHVAASQQIEAVLI